MLGARYGGSFLMSALNVYGTLHFSRRHLWTLWNIKYIRHPLFRLRRETLECGLFKHKMPQNVIRLDESYYLPENSFKTVFSEYLPRSVYIRGNPHYLIKKAIFVEVDTVKLRRKTSRVTELGNKILSAWQNVGCYVTWWCTVITQVAVVA